MDRIDLLTPTSGATLHDLGDGCTCQVRSDGTVHPSYRNPWAETVAAIERCARVRFKRRSAQESYQRDLTALVQTYPHGMPVHPPAELSSLSVDTLADLDEAWAAMGRDRARRERQEAAVEALRVRVAMTGKVAA